MAGIDSRPSRPSLHAKKEGSGYGCSGSGYSGKHGYSLDKSDDEGIFNCQLFDRALLAGDFFRKPEKCTGDKEHQTGNPWGPKNPIRFRFDE
jgi:hypothetical protein